MTTPSREHLLGYLLGALEPTEQEQVEAELDLNPALRAELDRLGGCVRGLGLGEQPPSFEPPQGLAARTCRFIAAQSQPAAVSAPPRRFRWADLVAVAAVLVIGISLFFPWLVNSHIASQIAACENNLRQLGVALQDYSNRHGSFPWPEGSGPRAAAGIYAPTLVTFEQLPHTVFLCPSSSLARGRGEFRVPTLDELDQATGPTLVALQNSMGGDYGYTLGYIEGGKLQKPRSGGRPMFPILADAPSDTLPGRVSANHRGQGQNLLCEDGHVRYLVKVPSAELLDDPFHNRDGRVAAGLDRDDAVIGTSGDALLPVLINNPGR
jgi:uncharacterized protein DUF1559